MAKKNASKLIKFLTSQKNRSCPRAASIVIIYQVSGG